MFDPPKAESSKREWGKASGRPRAKIFNPTATYNPKNTRLNTIPGTIYDCGKVKPRRHNTADKKSLINGYVKGIPAKVGCCGGKFCPQAKFAVIAICTGQSPQTSRSPATSCPFVPKNSDLPNNQTTRTTRKIPISFSLTESPRIW